MAKLRFPVPAPCGRTPLAATGLSKSYGSTEVFAGVDVAVDRGSRVVVLGLNGAGKTTLLRLLAGLDIPDTGKVTPGHGLSLGYYAQEHETLETERTVLAHMRTAAPDLTESQQRKVLGSFLFSGDDVEKPAGVLSGGEKTRLALALLVVSGANVLLLDKQTNNLVPAQQNRQETRWLSPPPISRRLWRRVAGILILVMPRLLNIIVAVYLIIVGLTGLDVHPSLHPVVKIEALPGSIDRMMIHGQIAL